MSVKDSTVNKRHLYALFAVQDNRKSHARAVVSREKGAIHDVPYKQKIDTCSDTEAQSVTFDNVLSKLIWTKLFRDAHGNRVSENIVIRYNQSSMKLETNGTVGSGKQTRHYH